ncbi:glyoxylase-like metal-dependent hydrolase (beta-lactamase superfamily II) [Lysinibacillus composti]|uniref:MBL fold metallo-hydrolase n=1 Tax=Lysinibacillus composti TaxID=720633 RepID=A0A3N9UI43_9BACI|nr:MBL fold metallo-hydrolase [Lysinibacillus composti]MBM7607808.1 glyoxylase-like metal-dependent hydrolase (beta-lactamase superfamily II) [Lysinibacillus composti]RQW75707.1 MBL fold metallo-hydrolase [Lysinibacillus composti]
MSEQMNYGDDYKFIPVTSIKSGVGKEVATDLYCYTVQVVNLCFVGSPAKPHEWTLVDAGMPKSADAIIKEAESRFGKNAKPNAIVLTHGHFDHVGAIIELVNYWNVPVYAHELEIPYLTGQKSYPEADPTVEGGLVARMSPYFPNEPIQLGDQVMTLPKDGTIPVLEGWKWIHTPGHSPGHVSLFREPDRALIAGDAFVTVKQESLFKVLVQDQEISGPPRYFTTDWKTAWDSVKKLQSLNPSIAITGHGIPMLGEELTENLTKLANEFEKIAIPDYGRYTDH